MRAAGNEHRATGSGRAGYLRRASLAAAVLAGALGVRFADAQMSSDAAVSRLKLRASAVADRPARLVNVLSFDEADPALLAAIGEQPVFAEKRIAPKTATPSRSSKPTKQNEADGSNSAASPDAVQAQPSVVTHDQIVHRLSELGVNMSRVLVCGAAECEIAAKSGATVSPAPAARGVKLSSAATVAADTEVNEPAAPLMRSPPGEHSTAALTLADALRERVQRELRAEGRAEVEFERAGGEFLALTAPPWEFNIRTADSGKLGVREFSVALKRDGKTQRSISIGANVKLSRQVLVARRPLSVGACIRDDDLAAEERLFESATEPGYTEPAELLGQQVQRFVPAGEMLKRGDVKAVDLVQRSRPVTVVGAGGGVSLQVTGVALDAGGYGETVRVRLGDTRKDQREVRGVVTGIATVKIAGEGA